MDGEQHRCRWMLSFLIFERVQNIYFSFNKQIEHISIRTFSGSSTNNKYLEKIGFFLKNESLKETLSEAVSNTNKIESIELNNRV